VLYIMQASTCGQAAGVGSAIVRELHRATLCTLSLALMVAAGMTLNDGSDPRVADFMIHLALLAAVALWVVRHATSRPVRVRRSAAG
jgi:peptidoglycan/LPS O-acetylase OafA/YrhL